MRDVADADAADAAMPDAADADAVADANTTTHR